VYQVVINKGIKNNIVYSKKGDEKIACSESGALSSYIN